MCAEEFFVFVIFRSFFESGAFSHEVKSGGSEVGRAKHRPCRAAVASAALRVQKYGLFLFRLL